MTGPTAHHDGSVLLLSMRRVAQLVAYCIEYECEDVLQECTSAERIDVSAADLPALSRRLYKYARLATGSRRIAKLASFGQPSLQPTGRHELFFPILNEPFELLALAALPDWRARARVAACYVSEVWTQNTPRYVLELLSDFDHIFLGVSHSTQDITRLTGRPCTYLPLGVDVLRFAPASPDQVRPIDICNIGRRSEITHAALLNRAADPDFFYFYDTVAASGVDLKQRTFRVQDAAEHRRLLSSVLKRSRYFIANKGFVNDPSLTRGADAIAARYYEGAAAGTVMIGAAPDTDEFRTQFDWKDCVIDAAFDAPTITDTLRELDADAERLNAIRRENVFQAATRHDWLYRLEDAFAVLDIPPSTGMRERRKRLQRIATAFSADRASVS